MLSLNQFITQKVRSHEILVFYFCGLFSLLAVLTAIVFDEWKIIFIPLVIGYTYLFFKYPKIAFLAFFGVLPFSIETYFSNGLGTDLPSEPIILFLFVYSIFHLLDKKSLTINCNAITILLTLHVFWIAFSIIWADFNIVSAKFLIAKLWYVLPFYYLSQHFLKDKKDIDVWIKVFLIGFLSSVIYVMARHLSQGFSFDTIGWAVSPFYRNHVNYAALLVISLPLCWYKIKRSENKNVYIGILFVLLVAIYFSFTRAAIVAVIVMIISGFLVRFRILFHTMILSVLIVCAGLSYMIHDNNYLNYAPNYENTIAHTQFENLMEATYKMEDISTMERLHRWVAGFKMIQERPWTGFGPNNFYFTYKPYTNYSFKTYVSNNPDRSGIHNYFLMTAVEQGIIGLIIFLSFLFSAIYYGEKLYHSSKTYKAQALMCIMTISGIMTLLLINDLMEVVKVAPFLFISVGMISQLYWKEQIRKKSKS